MPPTDETGPARPSGPNPPRKRVERPALRLVDVARVARCSAATVSRVLNAPETVNAEARQRVEAAVQELGYARNGAARALRSRRSQMIGVILPTLKHPVYADFVGALQDCLAEEHYALAVTTSAYSLDRELLQARLLVERGVDGLVLIGHTHRVELLTLMQAQNLPFLSTYTFTERFPQPTVGFDNAAAMGIVVEHLHALGHRDFALLAGVGELNDRTQERIAGVEATLAKHGLALASGHRVEVPSFTLGGGRRGLARLLESGPPPTALICTSDVLAYGALVECRMRGLDVPGDLSVVGFDGLESSADVEPALTTLEVPAAEMGRGAGLYLIARLAGRRHPARVAIEPRLVLRATTAPPRADLRDGAAPR